MKNNLKRWTAIVIAVTLAVGCLPGNLQRKLGAQPEVNAEESINDPRIVADDSMEAGQKVTWDCVWFGSYPQTEIVDKAESCGTHGMVFEDDSDYIINVSIYNTLQSASGWDSNGDITLNGTKYRRIKKSDATYGTFGEYGFYKWSDSDTYHYYRYEPIKWRVLDREGSTIFLLADRALDDQKYNTVSGDVTWETSPIRRWINETFIDAAFTTEQKWGIMSSSLTNANNIRYGTAGGNDTNDKVFFLSESEVYTDNAKSYGFHSSYGKFDEGRICKSSTYAKAMGINSYIGTESAGNCDWWLRSPGENEHFAIEVTGLGYVNQEGYFADNDLGVRPALRLNLLYTDLYTYAGTVCSDGTVNEEDGSGGADLTDTDGDGLPDTWEKNGADINKDGKIDVKINEMGANPSVPDVFVEVDWMVSPAVKFLCLTLSEEFSYAPSQSSMKKVYQAFKDHGINLHIDVGPNSIDFVTGKKWGNLSGGNRIPFESDFPLGMKYSHWKSVANANFSSVRRSIFRHAMFINTYDEDTSSGIANDIPGQYFIVANQEWLRNTGDVGVAGTFMHELGHTLGLCHGGFDDGGNNNHIQYKPNYLSIMNYLFQTRGLAGTDELNYSEYTLPTIDEGNLIESNGIDPQYMTANTGLGTYLIYGGELIDNVSGKGIDFNGDGIISASSIRYNVNHDTDNNDNPIFGKLYSSEDWSHIKYLAGSIGSSGNQGESQSNERSLDHELTLEEALDNKVISNRGDASIQAEGPFTIIKDLSGQKLALRLTNMYFEDMNFSLDIHKSEITDEHTQDIILPGYTDRLIPKTVMVPIHSDVIAGTYTFSVSLKYEGETVCQIDISLDIYEPTDQEILELKEAIDKGELTKEEVSEEMLDVYKKLPDPTETSSTNETTVSKKVSMLTLAGISKKIARGKKIKLTATVLPKNATNRKLKWSSSNKKLATVTQSGMVKISKKAKPGKTVKITAASTDGSGKKAVWKIKIMKGAVKKITVKGYKKTLKAGKTMKLKAVVKTTKGKPVNKKLKWTSLSPKYATVTQTGKVKAKKASKGKTVKIKVMSTDGTNKSVVKKIKIK